MGCYFGHHVSVVYIFEYNPELKIISDVSWGLTGPEWNEMSNVRIAAIF